MSVKKIGKLKFEKVIEIIREYYFQSDIQKLISKDITRFFTDPKSVKGRANFLFTISLKDIVEEIGDYECVPENLFEEMMKREYPNELYSFCFISSNEYPTQFFIHITPEEIENIRDQIENFSQKIKATVMRKMLHDLSWISSIEEKLSEGYDLLVSDLGSDNWNKIMIQTETIIDFLQIKNFHPKFFNELLFRIIRLNFPYHKLAKFLPNL